MSVEALHPSVRWLAAEVLRFPSLRPVQAMTVEPVLAGRDAVVLAPTAGGKTEAAALPVLSRVLTERWEPVSVLWISPLRALLNNQAPRLGRMAEAVGLVAAKWHGDVGARERRAILAEPPALLLITPESMEVLLMTAPERAERLLGRARVAVVDEVHAFVGDARGAHLLSLLERVQRRAGRHLQRVGLSATVGDPEALAAWLQGSGAASAPVVVSPPGGAGEPELRFRAARDVAEVAQCVREAEGAKRLVFVQGRGRAEDVGRALEALGERAFVHHSAVGRAERDQAEQAFEGAAGAVLVATSSMELGVDVGDLDHVVQVDPPATVASLAQRLGRTGRRAGATARLTFAVDGPEDLLLALSLASLHREGWVEALRPSRRAWTVAVHQAFAAVLEAGGLTRGELFGRLRLVPSFAGIGDGELAGLIAHLTATGWLEEADGALVLGRAAESRYGRRQFFRLYAVFETAQAVSVRHGDVEVGTLERWFALQLGPRRPDFRLAGRGWRMVELDPDRAILRVIPTKGGEAPLWTGRPAGLSRTVCERILALLVGTEVPGGLDATCRGWLRAARESVAPLRLRARLPGALGVSPVRPGKDRTTWHTFAGARINRTLALLVEHLSGLTATTSNLAVHVRGPAGAVSEAALRVVEALATGSLPPLGAWATFDTERRSAILSSFQEHLPPEAEQEVLRDALLDVEGAAAWAGEVEVGGPQAV
ncbi:MAG: ATP-dependent helicase [Myxococcales bacterium]